MSRRPLLALALVSAVTGCVSAPPDGPFVEYRAGLTPITRPVKCPGTYALHADGQPAPLLTRDAVEGERIGFKREADSSVTAIAPEQELALPPGEYAWELVPGTTPPWRDRFRAKAGAKVGSAAQQTASAVVIGSGVAALIALKFLYAYAQGGGR